jgi:hypothetical protein
MSALAQIVPQLIAIITGFGTLSAPATLPSVTFVQQGEIANDVCGRPCPAYAMFDPDKGILLDERLDSLNDLNARSILLHELVHFLQWSASGRTPRGCAEWLQRERDAYEIQFAWLTRQTDGNRHFPVRRPVLSPVICRDRS